MRNKKGRPGVVPVTRGLFSRGASVLLDAITGIGSLGGEVVVGRAAPSAMTIAAPPQSAISPAAPSPPSLTNRIICLPPVRSTEIGVAG